MTYQDLKAIVQKKGLPLQYDESVARYTVFAMDGAVRYDTVIWRVDPGIAGVDYAEESINCADFESNHKAAANAPIRQPVQLYGFRKFDGQAWRKGFKYQAAAGSVSEFSEKFTSSLYVCGGFYEVDAAAAADDYIECHIVDLDNVLGQGSGYILFSVMETEFVGPGSKTELIFDDGAYVPAGVYIRARYVSNGLSPVGIKIRYYTRI